MASLLPFLLLLAVSRCSGWSAGLAHMPPTHVRLHAASPPLVMCDTQLPDAQSRADCRAMRVAEIKAELEVRGVSCEGVVEKDELTDLLARARVQGKASPDILDSFNKENLERAIDADTGNVESLDPEALQDVTAADGTLPGGMTPEELSSLTADPELMTMLRNPKMQEIMKCVMEKGDQGLAELLQKDPEAVELLSKAKGITDVLGGGGR